MNEINLFICIMIKKLKRNDNIQENEIIKLINKYKYISNNIQTLEK